MSQFWASPVQTAVTIGLITCGIGQCLCFVRLAIGPSLPDRIVSLDLIATLLIGMLVLSGMPQQRTESLRVATVLALINFLGTVMFSIYVRRKDRR